MLGFGTLLFGWLYSKTTPAWAPRYFAVIVGPLILLFALGLVRAGALGMAALALCACFWILDPQKPSVDSKSNVAAVIHHVRHDLPAGSLVLSTQPEQVPTIAYYLPHVTRYGTPLGPVPDRHIVDWRDALTKFRHFSVQRTLEPMLATLATRPAGCPRHAVALHHRPVVDEVDRTLEQAVAPGAGARSAVRQDRIELG